MTRQTSHQPPAKYPGTPADPSGDTFQRPPGTDRDGLGAHGQFEVPAGDEEERPEAPMGRSFGDGVGGLRDAAGTYSAGGDEYLRGGHGGAPRAKHVRRADARSDDSEGEDKGD